LKGEVFFIYELKRLELKAPAVGQPGEKLDENDNQRQLFIPQAVEAKNFKTSCDYRTDFNFSIVRGRDLIFCLGHREK